MSFMFRDKKETEFDYSMAPDALNSKEDLETNRSAILHLIEDCEIKIASYKRELNIIDFAIHNKFYR